MIDRRALGGGAFPVGAGEAQIHAGRVRGGGDRAARADFQAENLAVPIQQFFVGRREEMHVIAHHFHMQALVFLQFNINAVGQHDISVGLPFGAGEHASDFISGRAPFFQEAFDIAHFEAEMIHDGCARTHGGRAFAQRHQHIGQTHGGQRTFFHHHAAEILHPDPLVQFDVRDVEMNMAVGEAGGIGRGQLPKRRRRQGKSQCGKQQIFHRSFSFRNRIGVRKTRSATAPGRASRFKTARLSPRPPACQQDYILFQIQAR